MAHIVHVEIPADDVARSGEFWGGLFGWSFAPFPGPAAYHVARIDERSGAAVSGMEPGRRGLRTYFAVDDLRASAARVAELGGTAGDPTPVPGMGWFAHCHDPHGNEFGLWETDPTAPAPEG